jgi:hypothetical protein
MRGGKIENALHGANVRFCGTQKRGRALATRARPVTISWGLGGSRVAAPTRAESGRHFIYALGQVFQLAALPVA